MGGSSTTQVQENRPYEAAEPLIQGGLRDARRMYNQGGFQIQPYGGDMVADFTGTQRAGFQMGRDQVQAGLGALDASTAAAQRAMDPNQRSAAFDQVKQNVINDVMPAINGSFAGSGMTGSTLHAQNLAQGVTQGLAGVENQAFQQGEARALQAAGMMPGLNQARYGAADYMRGIGGEMQQHRQNGINARIIRDQQSQTAGRDALQDYLALTTGAGSMFGVQSGTQRSNPGLLGYMSAGMQALPFF